ncbi:MAG: protein-tyrosine phosphatase family protein [Pseudomonadota bacterium]
MQSQIFFIPVDARGRLAQMPHPRAGDSLRSELTALRDAGIDRIVSLLGANEADALGLSDEGTVFAQIGGHFSHFPISDFSLPTDPAAFFDLARSLATEVESGASVAVHCHAGIGRSTLLNCSILFALGVPVDDALALIAKHRGRPVPDTPQQRQWLYEHLR